MFGIHRNFPAGGGGSTGDATAEQWDIKNGLTAYIASGKVTGSGYFPAAMEFDGSTGYYSSTYTSSGNKVTAVFCFKRATFAGTSAYEGVINAGGPTGDNRCGVLILSSDYSASARQGKLQVQVQNSSATVVCRLLSTSSVIDDVWHHCFFSFDGDAGTASLIIDGVDADDTGNADRVAPTTGTLDSGASSSFDVGRFAATRELEGSIRFCGMRDVGGLSWSDFFQTDGSPKNIESTLNTVWGGGAPLFWHESAKMDENAGSAGSMTKNGTITLAAASSWS